jgi:hypothetical protein
MITPDQLLLTAEAEARPGSAAGQKARLAAIEEKAARLEAALKRLGGVP